MKRFLGQIILAVVIFAGLLRLGEAALPIFWAAATGFQSRGVNFNALGTAYVTGGPGVPQTDGTTVYCTDCGITNTTTICQPGGTGSWATRLGGVWYCASSVAPGTITFTTPWLNPKDFGAKFDAKGYAAGSVNGTTTFTDSTNSPFTSSDTGKYITIYGAKQGTNWTTTMSCPHGTLIEPLTSNAGNYVYFALQDSTGTAGAGNPTFNQTAGSVTTDGTCAWVNLGYVGMPLVTTVTFATSSTLTLGSAATRTASGLTYVYGTDDGGAINVTGQAAAALTPNGGGLIQLPCAAAVIVTPIVFNDQGLTINGCGWGRLASSTGTLGPGLLWMGAAGADMINMRKAWGITIENVRLKGNSGSQPTNIFNYVDTGAIGPQEMITMRSIYIGSVAKFATEPDLYAAQQVGLAMTPASGGANNGPGSFKNLFISGDTNYSIDIPNTEFLAQHFDGIEIEDPMVMAGIRDAAAQVTFDNLVALLTPLTRGTNYGRGVFDLLSGADVTVRSFAGEQSSRLYNCDMNGGGSMSASIYFENGYFQLNTGASSGNGSTATDGIIGDCGTAAIGGAVLGPIHIGFKNFLITNNGSSPFSTTPGAYTFALDNTTGNNYLSTFDGDQLSGQGIYFGLANVNAQTSSVASVSGGGVNPNVSGPNSVTVRLKSHNQIDVATSSRNGSTTTQEKVINVPIAAHQMTLSQLSPPDATATNSVCTVTNAGAATCLYVVEACDSLGCTTPSQVITCSSSAVLNSQNNSVAVVGVPGAVTYKLFGDSCAAGTAFALLSTTNADSVQNLTPKSGLLNFSDNSIARGGAAPDTVNATGSTTLAKGPTAIGQALREGDPLGQVAATSLNDYTTTLTKDGATVLFHLGIASGNDTDVINGRTATAAGTVTYSQAGAIQDFSNTAVKLNGSTGTFTAGAGTGLCTGDTCSCEAWVKFTSLAGNNQFIVGQKVNGFAFYKTAAASGQYLVLAKEGGANVLDAFLNPIPDLTYHYVAFGKNAGTAAKIWIDGQDRSYQHDYTNQTWTPADSTMYIGSDAATVSWLNGTIDEVSCYNNVYLTDAQVMNHYQRGLAQKFGSVLYNTTAGCLAILSGSGDYVNQFCGDYAGASLPTCNAAHLYGQAVVTDNVACAYGATPVPTASAGVGCPVFCDGTSWKIR